MAARRDATASPPTASTAGILRPDELAQHVDLVRRPAGLAVAPWVENHWSLRWDLADGQSFTSQVLPHPTCSLTVEVGYRRAGLPDGTSVFITGVTTARFDVEIRDAGRVLGVRFRPGGLAALTGQAATAWTDGVVPAADALPASLCATLADPDVVADVDAWVAEAEAGLVAMAPDRGGEDARYERLVAIVADMLADRSLLTVADVAARHGVSVRTLQRLFTRYVGIGPKWVLARYRMHDVVSAIDAGYEGTLTDLAHRFGWYDQAHFTRDFTALVGVPPRAYRDGPTPARSRGGGR